MKRIPHTVIIACSIAVVITALSQCVDKPENITIPDIRGMGYIGAEACSSCHAAIFNSYVLTAHHNSSASAAQKTIKGSFDSGRNTYTYRPGLEVRMEQRDSALCQVARLNGIEKQVFPFGVVIGSGRKAQTYLYWYGDNVFQLPVSWSATAAGWVNSPNYPPDRVRFDRLINVGCFECHGSYISLKGTQQEGFRTVDYFDKSKVIYGIDCERCHGPAAEHVLFHKTHPEEKEPRHIATYASLSRQARLDLCAQCHSGAHTEQKSIFLFKPGDTLGAYFLPSSADQAPASELDVHGNQYQLLAASACFQKSTTLDCASCHNTHRKERDDLTVFSQRCMSCHDPAGHNFCTMKEISLMDIRNNCIDCHMPQAPSRLIAMKAANQPDATPNPVRTHLIAVYRKQATKYADSLSAIIH